MTFRRAWSNGQRGLLIAGALFAASLLFLFAVIGLAFYVDGDTYAPLHNVNPQTVGASLVVQGGILTVVGTKCVRGDRPVYTMSRAWFRRFTPSHMVVPYLVTERSASPGCSTRTFQNMIPDDLPLGTWRLEGVDVAIEGARTQREAWYTEEFTVVEGPRG